MANVGSLNVDLNLQSAQFIEGLKKAAAATAETANKMTASLNRVKQFAAGFLTGFASGFSLEGIEQRIQEAFDYGDALVDLADKTGASTKTLQEFRYAAQLSGSSVESADAAVEKFAKNLGAAQNGNKAMAKTFAELGVTSRDTDEAFKQTIEGISKLETVTQRNQQTMELFGKSAGDLTVLMSGGRNGYDELAAAAQAYGIVIDDQVLRSGGAMNDQLDTMKMIFNSQLSGMIIQNADALMALAGAFVSAAAAAAQFFASFDAKRLVSLQSGNIGDWDLGTVGMGLREGKSVDQIRKDARDKLWTTHNGREELFKSNAQRYNERLKAGYRLKDDKEMQQLRQDNINLVKADRAARIGKIMPSAVPTLGEGNGVKPKPVRGGGAGGGAKSKPSPVRLKSPEELAEQWETALGRRQSDLLRAQGDLTSDPMQRQRLDEADLRSRFRLDGMSLDLDTGTEQEVKEGKKRYTEAQAKQLRQIEQEILDAEIRGTLTDRDADLLRDHLTLSTTRLSIDSETLNAEMSLSRSTSERRAKSLALVRNSFEQERLQLEQTIELEKLGKATKAEREAAELRLKALPALQKLAEEGAKRQNQSPLEAYLDQIPKTKEEMSDALEAVEVEGLKSLEDGLMGIIDGTKSVGDAFSDMGKTIINSLIKIGLQQAIIAPLGKMLFGSGDGGLGGIFGSLLHGARANGGMTQPGNYLVGERGPEVVSIGANANVATNRALRNAGGGQSNGVTVNFGHITSNDPAAVKAMAYQAAMELAPVFREQAVNATMTKLRRPNM